MRVLIVQAEVDSSEDLRKKIESWGYEAETCQTGKDAREKVKQRRFDVVLCDMSLPDTKGYELIPQFKHLGPEMKIITMIDHTSKALETKIRQHGILFYLIKPFDMQYLEGILAHISTAIKKSG